jgi:hypothetical protein
MDDRQLFLPTFTAVEVLQKLLQLVLVRVAQQGLNFIFNGTLTIQLLACLHNFQMGVDLRWMRNQPLLFVKETRGAKLPLYSDVLVFVLDECDKKVVFASLDLVLIQLIEALIESLNQLCTSRYQLIRAVFVCVNAIAALWHVQLSTSVSFGDLTVHFLVFFAQSFGLSKWPLVFEFVAFFKSRFEIF